MHLDEWVVEFTDDGHLCPAILLENGHYCRNHSSQWGVHLKVEHTATGGSRGRRVQERAVGNL